MGRLRVSTRVVCSHWISLVSQLTLARACRTLLAHLSTATRRSTGSLQAWQWKQREQSEGHLVSNWGWGDAGGSAQQMSQSERPERGKACQGQVSGVLPLHWPSGQAGQIAGLWGSCWIACSGPGSSQSCKRHSEELRVKPRWHSPRQYTAKKIMSWLLFPLWNSVTPSSWVLS